MAGMTISTSGVLLRAAERLERTRDSKQLGYMLRGLYDHLKLLKAEPANHGKFFELYVDLDRPSGNEQEEPECPRCKGHGVVVAWSGSASNGTLEQTADDCPECASRNQP